MERGSKGAGVTLVLTFLITWFNVSRLMGVKFLRSEIESFKRLKLDDDFGKVGVACMKIFQKYEKLQRDGGFGPKTRNRAKRKYGFDFAEAMRPLGNTRLVQADGTILVYDYGSVSVVS